MIHEENLRDPRIYEISFLCLPTLSEEECSLKKDEIKAYFIGKESLFLSEGTLDYIDLSYPMFKIIENKRIEFNQAYFTWVKYEINPSFTNELKKFIEDQKQILRVLFIEAPREDTFFKKKLNVKKNHEEGEIEAEVLIDESEEIVLPHEKIEKLVEENPEEVLVSSEEITSEA